MSSNKDNGVAPLAPDGQGVDALSAPAALGSLLPTPLIDAEKVQAKAEEIVVDAREARREARTARREAREAAKNAVRETRSKLRQTSKTRKSAATKQRIIDAASDLITERGGVDFQMSEVADICDMSKGALYYYFSDREDLVREIFDQGIDEFVSSLENAVTEATSSEGAIRSLCLEFAKSVHMGGPVFCTMAAELVHGRSDVITSIEQRFFRITNIIGNQLERAKGEGIVRPDVNSAMASSFVCGSFFFAAIEEWSDAGENFDERKFANDLVDLMMRGVGTAPLSI